MTRVVAIRVLIVVAAIAFLEAATRTGVVNRALIVPPSVMAAELWTIVQDGAFWAQVGISARSIALAFVLSLVVGCLVALVLHAMPRVRASLEPLIASYYALPFFVLYPLLIGLAIDDLLADSLQGMFHLGLLAIASVLVGSARRLYDTRIYAGIYERVAVELVEREALAGASVSRTTARADLLTLVSAQVIWMCTTEDIVAMVGNVSPKIRELYFNLQAL